MFSCARPRIAESQAPSAAEEESARKETGEAYKEKTFFHVSLTVRQDGIRRTASAKLLLKAEREAAG
jgi:hypothetical protein